MKKSNRIVVTGMGVCSPIGRTLHEMAEQLEAGRTGIKAREHIYAGETIWAALVEDFEPAEHFTAEERNKFDRTAQMGYLAALQALQDAGLEIGNDSSRCGLVLGTSHGGRSQLDRFIESGSDIDAADSPRRVLETSAHYFQTASVASKLGLHGPAVTLSNACSSSGAAIAYAFELIRSGQCDWVLAGGADGFSKLTHAGFAALGAVADGPCAPFSESIGISLGDGAAFIVLESLERAEARGRKIHSELYGYGLSWDAYHITAPEPSGEGMNQAIAMALEQSGLQRDQIDYVNVHGTGTRSNDAAESVGLKRYFANADGSHSVPPISATKSFTGHMLGASSVMGVITSIVGMQRGWLPPTANFTAPRPGCELDCVPNVARPAKLDRFMAQSAAFAGANAVIVGGRVQESDHRPDPQDDGIVVTGIGIVSPIGVTLDDFAAAVNEQRSGALNLDEKVAAELELERAGLVRDFNPRKLMPSLNLRRVDKVAAYATIAVSLALKDAGMWPLVGAGCDIGLIVGLTRGAAGSYEKYLEGVKGENWKAAGAVQFPNLVMSSVGGQVSSTLGIRGITSSLVGAGSSGLQALIHAAELFRRNPRQEAVVVVAADELAALYTRLFRRREAARSRNHRDVDFAEASTMILGEGAAAWVLRRKSSIAGNGNKVYGELLGHSLTSDACLPNGCDASGRWLEDCIRQSLASSRIENPRRVRRYRVASGRAESERRDVEVLERVFGCRCSSSVTPLTGYSESASGLFNATAALWQLNGSCNGIDVEPSQSDSAIVFGSGEDGSNASVCLRRYGSERAMGNISGCEACHEG